MNSSDQQRDDKESTPFPTKDNHPEFASDPGRKLEKKQPTEEDRLDEGLDETFPASDPVSITTKKAKPKS